MEDAHGAVALGAEPGRKLLDQDDRSMLPAGTPDGDCQAALALGLERRDRECEEGLQQGQKLSRRRLSEDEVPNRLGQPGMLAQLKNVVRVLEKARVEHEVGFKGHPELEPEAQQLDRHTVRLEVPEPGEQALAQVTQWQIRGIDHDVGLGSNTIEHHALIGDRGGDSAALAERVAVAGLREAPDQHLVACLEEEDLRANAAALQGAAHRSVRRLGIAGANAVQIALAPQMEPGKLWRTFSALPLERMLPSRQLEDELKALLTTFQNELRK